MLKVYSVPGPQVSFWSGKPGRWSTAGHPAAWAGIWMKILAGHCPLDICNRRNLGTKKHHGSHLQLLSCHLTEKTDPCLVMKLYLSSERGSGCTVAAQWSTYRVRGGCSAESTAASKNTASPCWNTEELRAEAHSSVQEEHRKTDRWDIVVVVVVLKSGLNRMNSPAMIRREKRRRPKPRMLDVIGIQVGISGSPITFCFLISTGKHKLYTKKNTFL